MVALLSYKTLHTHINCVLFQQGEAFPFTVLLLMAPCSFKGTAVSESTAFNKITIDWWGEEQNNEKNVIGQLKQNYSFALVADAVKN